MVWEDGRSVEWGGGGGGEGEGERQGRGEKGGVGEKGGRGTEERREVGRKEGERGGRIREK